MRIGPRMLEVARLANRPGGIAIIDAARLVGPHRSTAYGYQSVHRAIRAGLVIRGFAQEKGRKGALITTLQGV